MTIDKNCVKKTPPKQKRIPDQGCGRHHCHRKIEEEVEATPEPQSKLSIIAATKKATAERLAQQQAEEEQRIKEEEDAKRPKTLHDIFHDRVPGKGKEFVTMKAYLKFFFDKNYEKKCEENMKKICNPNKKSKKQIKEEVKNRVKVFQNEGNLSPKSKKLIRRLYDMKVIEQRSRDNMTSD